MKHYLNLAREYFVFIEGTHLYPTAKTWLFWMWITITAVWLGSLAYLLVQGKLAHQSESMTAIVILEFFWLIVCYKVRDFKRARLIETTNERFGTEFRTAEECRGYALSSITKIKSDSFLSAAKEIEDLRSFKKKYRKRSDISLAELARNIYDSDSKQRLLALILAVVSILTVAVVAKSDMAPAIIFDIFANQANRTAFAILMFVAALLFFLFIGLRSFSITLWEIVSLWHHKLRGRWTTSEWLLAYLVRDLIEYHTRFEEVRTVSEMNLRVENVEATFDGVPVMDTRG